MIPFQTEEELAAVERSVRTYGSNDLMSPPTVTFVSHVKKPDFDRMVVTAKVGIKFQQMSWHGCLSGDCPHTRQVECNAALANAYREAMEDV